MLLGEWWVANPSNATENYEPPDPADRVPGTLREVAHGRFALETIGFLGDRPPMAGGLDTSSDRAHPEIWGTDRNATCYSLFGNLRLNSMWSPGHVFDGYEDWQVGWLAKGDVWVLPDEECTSARIHIDGLRSWALHRESNNVEFDYDRLAATIDLRHEVLGSTTIGDVNVSLVRDSEATFGSPDQDPERHFSFANVVYWRVEGPVMLRTLVTDWYRHFESFIRFMTMDPSVVSGIKCDLSQVENRKPGVELIVPRLPRGDQTADREVDQPSPHMYLATARTLQELDIDPMGVLASYWRHVGAGDAYTAMALHLESQDRLLNRGSDGALLNAIRSVESLYAVQNPGARVERVAVQDKIDHAVSRAGDVGIQILSAWPDLRRIGELRRDVAHGRSQPSAEFDLRCVGGAMALQWIQRVQLLAELGISESTARWIVSENLQYPWDLLNLQNWSAELS